QQVTAAQDSVAAIKRQMRQDQRPWLFIPAGSERMLPMEMGKDIVDEVYIVNGCKTFARNVVTNFCLRMAKKGEDPDFNYSDHFFSCVTSEMGTFFPGEAPRYLRVPVVTTTRAGTKRTVHPLQKDIDWFHGGDYYVAVYGTISYDDDFGHSHWTKYCRGILAVDVSKPQPKAPSKKCVDYNDADRNN